MISITKETDQARLMDEIGSFDQLMNQTAEYWQQRLIDMGLGGIRADGPVTGLCIQEPAFADSGLVAAYDHPIHGAGLRHGAMSHWPLSQRRLQGPCQSGDATVMLLRELGKTPEQVRTLRNSGVVKNAAEALS